MAYDGASMGIYHNTIVRNSRGIYIRNDAEITGNVIKNNIVINNAVAQISDLTGAQTIANNLATGVVTDIFSNPSANDFHLKAGSAAIDAGVNVGITRDYDGVTIPQGSAPDIGAYEFVGTITSTK